MKIIYNLVFFLVIIFHLPLYIIRRKFHRGLIRRLGYLPRPAAFNKPIWVHAVSVGEAMAVRQLISDLRESYPGKQFVISTVTATGNVIARQAAADGDFVTYLPFDISCVLKRVLCRVSPGIFIVAETELWPNLIRVLHELHIPIVIVNARMSDSSFRRYRLAGRMFKPVLKKITMVLAQSDPDAQRFLRLGIAPERVHIIGNMKFDAVGSLKSSQDYSHLRRRLGLGPTDILLVGGSTHAGEEEILMQMYQALHQELCGLKVLIAPRHPERSDRVAATIKKYYFDAVKLSSVEPLELHQFSRRSVFILDCVGELLGYYAASDLVFVGGSLVKKGGHNILEPAVFGKPILFGPHMENFRDIAEMFLERRAAVRVNDKGDVLKEVKHLIDEPAFAAATGERASRLVHENTGSTKRARELIQKIWNTAS